MNVASLDAPCVAICWQHFFAKSFEVKLTWIEPLILFIATWLAYSADRWLDGRRYPENELISARHRVFRKAGHLPIVVWISVASLGLFLSLSYLNQKQVVLGFGFLTATLVYFVMHWLSPSQVRKWLPRELIVALFFAIACALFVFGKMRVIQNIQLFAVVSFFVLCFLNILGVACWEYEQDKKLGEVSLATTFPFLVNAHFLICICVSAFGLVMLLNRDPALPNEVLFCVVVSPILIGLLGRFSMLGEVRPTLADCALLTPLVLIGS